MLLDYCTLDPIPDVFGAIQKACKKKNDISVPNSNLQLYSWIASDPL